ncbi:MAG: heavy metal translocating P-type ATPase, partial [Desulfovibrio sp.]|nr:heavy metal translocating P-type ATPase [Desulfovibrio sp.]
FEFTVTAAARDTTLARIIHAVEEAQATRAPMQRFVDSFARWYTPAVFALAVVTALVPPLFFGAAWAGSVYMALVLLVIGCPCALVISTPVTVVSGMAAAARKGILIKGGAYLEQGRLLDRLALDKTGTLTRGEPVQTDFVLLAEEGRRDEIARMAASLAARSDHPVSRAVAAASTNLGLLDMEAVEALPGEGVAGSGAGRRWYLGNYRLMERLGAGSPALKERMSALEADGKTTVVLASAELATPEAAHAEALFAVADGLRETSVEAVAELKALGVRTVLLTGDTEATAKAMAKAAGVDEYRAGLLPQDKLAIVEELERTGAHVGMVGDGINDAPALAKANIGFAMAAGGTDTAIETADVALMDDDLRKVPRFIRLSRATHAILVENIAFALSIKAVFFALTFAGMATMWMAVFADVGASLVVVANGLRVMRK